ncbi:MAG: type II toxin-antitoxin system PemK/MazF family toxin [bacterium]
MHNRINQFEIWKVNLNPAKGSEQKGERPCLILQTNASSDYGRTTIIAPITTKKIDKIYPFEVKIEISSSSGLKQVLKIKLDQVRVIDKNRLIKKLGKIEQKDFNQVQQALEIIFDMAGDFRKK